MCVEMNLWLPSLEEKFNYGHSAIAAAEQNIFSNNKNNEHTKKKKK